jgi:hypothetical protein
MKRCPFLCNSMSSFRRKKVYGGEKASYAFTGRAPGVG